MDPNETLAELRKLCEGDEHDESCGEMVELFEALDGWLTSGGFRPADWNKK